MFCYIGGIWCLILQITTYVLMQESNAVKVPITVLTGFVVLPFLVSVVSGDMRSLGSEG